MYWAIESNLATPPESGEEDGSENNRLRVNSLNVLPAALAAEIVINQLHTSTKTKSMVFFVFIFFRIPHLMNSMYSIGADKQIIVCPAGRLAIFVVENEYSAGVE
jgi:hypothetical protein